MKLKGKAKEVWWRYRNINDSKHIPSSIDTLIEVDTNADDDYLYYIIHFVKDIREIFFKDTCVTDAGVQYITALKTLKKLSLTSSNRISNACIPYLNELSSLEYLDLTKTGVDITGISRLTALTNLQELHITSEITDEAALEKTVNLLKQQLPSCAININYILH